MTDEKVERKVAAILTADVAGYSTPMEASQDQTLQPFRACRKIIRACWILDLSSR